MAELKMYVDYFDKEVKKHRKDPSANTEKYLTSFKDNLLSGMQYYATMIPKLVSETQKYRDTMKAELVKLKQELETTERTLPFFAKHKIPVPA